MSSRKESFDCICFVHVQMYVVFHLLLFYLIANVHVCFFFFLRFTNDGLKRLCEIFDLEKKGKRVRQAIL